MSTNNYFVLLFCLCPLLLWGQEGEWTEKASIPGPSRHHPVGWGIGDTGYVVGGTGSSDYVDFYKYDPTTDTWQQKNDFPGQPRGYAIGIEYEGKGYLGFGYDGSSDFDDLWVYDPQTGQWDSLAPCPVNRRHPVLEAHNGKIYTGLGNNNFNLDDWWVYDISTDTWGQLPDLPGVPRHHPYHFTIGDYVYAGLGHPGGNCCENDWYRFDPTDSSWLAMADLPEPGGRAAGTQFAHDGKGYLLSGDEVDHSYSDSGVFWQYIPDSNKWNLMPPHPGESRWAPTSFVVHDTVYLIAGYNKKTPVLYNDVWGFPLPVEEEAETGVTQVKESGKLNVYPNPAHDHLYLDGNQRFSAITIYNAQGQVVHRTGHTKRLSVARLPQGIYLLQATDARGMQYMSRFMVH